jgi:hypothetical protein
MLSEIDLDISYCLVLLEFTLVRTIYISHDVFLIYYMQSILFLQGSLLILAVAKNLNKRVLWDDILMSLYKAYVSVHPSTYILDIASSQQTWNINCSFSAYTFFILKVQLMRRKKTLFIKRLRFDLTPKGLHYYKTLEHNIFLHTRTGHLLVNYRSITANFGKHLVL